MTLTADEELKINTLREILGPGYTISRVYKTGSMFSGQSYRTRVVEGNAITVYEVDGKTLEQMISTLLAAVVRDRAKRPGLAVHMDPNVRVSTDMDELARAIEELREAMEINKKSMAALQRGMKEWKD